MSLEDEYRAALDRETEGRPADATLERVLRGVQRTPSRAFRLGAVALAGAAALTAFALAARPRDEVFHLSVAESTHPEAAMELDMHQKTSRFPAVWSTLSRTAALAASLVVSTAHAEPAQTNEPEASAERAAGWSDTISARRVSMELKGVHVGNFFRIAAQIANANIFVDECASGRTVDLAVKNVPLPVALEAVRQQLGLSYTWRGESLHVACTAADSRRVLSLEQATLDLPLTRLTMELKEVPAAKVFELLGSRDHVQFHLDACAAEKTVTVRLKNLPLRDIAVAIAESQGLDYQREGDAWRVRCVR